MIDRSITASAGVDPRLLRALNDCHQLALQRPMIAGRALTQCFGKRLGNIFEWTD